MSSKINLLQLETFLSVVRCGGIGKAAEQLNLTQPAVTTRIRNLEYSVSASLFERTTQGLKLTKRGEMLLTYAERFLHLSELVERDVVDPKGLERRFRLGVSETIAQSWLPDFIESMNEAFPKLSVEINVDISTALRNSLLNRDIDLAIMLGPVSEFSIDNIALPEFELSWYASKDLNREDAQKLNRPIASYARNTRPYRELKSSLFEKVGPDTVIYPSSSLSACFRLVEAGLCVAALPKALAKSYLEKGSIYEFDPGWVPNSLRFTASYIGDPRSHLTETAAKIALKVSKNYRT
jgi:DNA-binding transcriptional LysR family regulator